MKSNRSFLLIAALAAAPLASCSQGDAEEQAVTEPAKPDNGLLEITHPRIVLPAVDGNPAAVYFDAANPGSDTRTIVAVDLAGVDRTEFHSSMNMGGKMSMEKMDSIPVDGGSEVSLAPGGLHIMAFGIHTPLKEAGASRTTITLDNGESFDVYATVQSAGDDR